jgi:hypothetical protein
MLGFLVTVKKSEENGGGVVAKWDDHSMDFYGDLQDLKKKGKALCIHYGGGYPNKYTAKASDVIPLIKKALNGRPDVAKNGSFWMMGYGIVPDIPVATTKDITEIPSFSPDETLLIELWDLS